VISESTKRLESFGTKLVTKILAAKLQKITSNSVFEVPRWNDVLLEILHLCGKKFQPFRVVFCSTAQTFCFLWPIPTRDFSRFSLDLTCFGGAACAAKSRRSSGHSGQPSLIGIVFVHFGVVDFRL
jgi:hypothetical protein